MYTPVPSPFEVWRTKHLAGMGMSRDLLTLIAEAFEGGRIAEREEITLLCHEVENDFKEELGVTGDPKFYERMLGVVECIDEIRARG